MLGAISVVLGLIAIILAWVLYERSGAQTYAVAVSAEAARVGATDAAKRLQEVVGQLEKITTALQIERTAHNLESYIEAWLNHTASDGSCVTVGAVRSAVQASRFGVAKTPSALRALEDRDVVGLEGPADANASLVHLRIA